MQTRTFPISPTVPLQLQLAAAPRTVVAYRINNNTPFDLQVKQGKTNRSIAAYNADRFDMDELDVNLAITAANQDPSLPNPPTLSSQLTLDMVYDVDGPRNAAEAFPGSYPQQLVRQTARNLLGGTTASSGSPGVSTGPFTLHVNSGVAVTPAAPYTLWHLSQAAINPPGNVNLIIHGWSLHFDNIVEGGGNCFASLNGTGQTVFSAPNNNGPEIWNMQLSIGGVVQNRASEIEWDTAVVAPGAPNTGPTLNSDLQFQAPIAGSSYQVRGTMVIELVPVSP